MSIKREVLRIPFKGGFIEVPKPQKGREDTPKPKRPFHDGIAYYQSCIDDEWERYERNDMFYWDKKSS